MSDWKNDQTLLTVLGIFVLVVIGGIVYGATSLSNNNNATVTTNTTDTTNTINTPVARGDIGKVFNLAGFSNNTNSNDSSAYQRFVKSGIDYGFNKAPYYESSFSVTIFDDNQGDSTKKFLFNIKGHNIYSYSDMNGDGYYTVDDYNVCVFVGDEVIKDFSDISWQAQYTGLSATETDQLKAVFNDILK